MQAATYRVMPSVNKVAAHGLRLTPGDLFGDNTQDAQDAFSKWRLDGEKVTSKPTEA